MTSTDTNVSQSNDSSSVMIMSRKVGRKAKSKNILSESRTKRNQNFAVINTDVVNEGNEIKLFPIFNLSAKNDSVDNISDHKEPDYKNRKQKRAKSKLNSLESDLLIDSPPKQVHKATRKKRHTIVKDLKIESDEKSLKCDSHNKNQITDVSIKNDELPLNDIGHAFRETGENFCTEIQLDCGNKYPSVKLNESLKSNSDLKSIRNSVSEVLTDSHISELISSNISCKSSTSIQVSKECDRNELKFDKKVDENNCMHSEDPSASLENEDLKNITLKNNLSTHVPKDSISSKLKPSQKKVRQKKSASKQISFASLLKNQLNDVSLKTNDEGCLMMETELSQVSSENCTTSELKSNRKKYVRKKSITGKAESMLIMKDNVMENVSSRRQSLRNKGKRDNLLNYCEISSPSKMLEKQKDKNHSDTSIKDITTDIVDSKSDTDVEEVAVKVKSKHAKRNKNKRKNVKEDFKLFPIFSSKCQLNESKNIPEKRKAQAIEENNVENDAVAEKNIISKRKKAKNQSNINFKNPFPASDTVCIDLEKKFNDPICMANDEIKFIKESSDDSDVCVIQDSSCIGKSNEELREKNSKKWAEKLYLKVTDKQKFTANDNICFPLFSHLNTSSIAFPDIPNRYHINEEICEDIVLPTWEDMKGLIDSDCRQMIKTQDECYSVRKPKVHELLDAVSTIKDENSTLWTDSVQQSVVKEKNKDTVAEIKSWLLQWKNKFSSYSTNSNDDSESCSSYDSENDFISNGIIISGAPGSGKTSLVFNLANELGFTVLEVNASSCRNGRNISHQLKEALESYHVEGVMVENSNMGDIFGERKEKKIANSKEKDDSDLSEINKTKGIQSFFKTKTPDLQQKNARSLKRKENGTNIFQISDETEEVQNLKSKGKTKGLKKKTGDDSKKHEKNSQLVDLKNKLSENPKKRQNFKNESKTASLKTDVGNKLDISKKNSETTNIKSEKKCKISSLTIILFDDVDVVFEEDDGFWSTVKGFLKISKKPVIFTVGRNLSIVKAILNSGIRIFDLKPISKEVALLKLREYCSKHSRKSTCFNFELLTSQNICDLRRNILNAQFWTITPKSIEKIGSETNKSELNSIPISKLIHANSFVTGDLKFSTRHIQHLLFDCSPSNFANAILQYESLGYDILFCNLFNILYKLSFTECERLWSNLIPKFQNCDSITKQFSDSEMWKEACELYKIKKKALKNGSCSEELSSLADALSDFSYADVIKGQSCNKFQWISLSERVKMWTAGLPVCSDQNLRIHKDVLDFISLIHIFILRKLQKAISFEYAEGTNDILLDLEHPFLHFDQSFASKTEDHLECISSIIPPSQLLNKTTLTVDYLSTIKIMCQNEKDRQLLSGKRSGRFLHYFDSISLYIDRRMF